jgi:ATP-binding cassette subfamily D (ALD) long-chain fatty acid import protein
MNLARLFYHRPMFGVLDECTSAVSTDVEGLMYSRAKNMGITLITVSHRPSLLKHHTYLLQLSGENGEWSFSQLGTKQSLMSVDAELKDLETRIADEDRLMRRLAEINGLLGVKLNATKK